MFKNNETVVRTLKLSAIPSLSRLAEAVKRTSSGTTMVAFQRRDHLTGAPLVSIIASQPLLTVTIQGRQARLDDEVTGESSHHITGSPFDYLATVMAHLKDSNKEELPEPGFKAGLIGYLGYGLTATTTANGRIEQQKEDPFGIPDAHLFAPALLISIDHKSALARIISSAGEALCLKACRLLEDMQLVPDAATTGRSTDRCPLPSMKELVANGTIVSAMGKERFIANVNRLKGLIEEGEAFQVVLSHRLTAEAQVTGTEVLANMEASARGGYLYLFSTDQFDYVGASPERLLGKEGSTLSVRALAGTRKRGRRAEDDLRMEAELTGSAKEMAEHMMLVDLARNDLGRVSKPGSVRVGKIASVIRLANVMHLSTDITAEIDEGLNAFHAVEACFPRGTVSGAPKVRALELLSRMEEERRGIYSGAVGYFDIGGDCDTAIAIRSAFLKDGLAHINAGAGIVSDSSPEQEYLETLNKARVVIEALLPNGAGKRQELLEETIA